MTDSNLLRSFVPTHIGANDLDGFGCLMNVNRKLQNRVLYLGQLKTAIKHLNIHIDFSYRLQLEATWSGAPTATKCGPS